MSFVKLIKVSMAYKGISQKELAYKLGLSEPELSRKFNGERAWTNEEIDKVVEILDIKFMYKDQLVKLMAGLLEVNSD